MREPARQNFFLPEKLADQQGQIHSCAGSILTYNLNFLGKVVDKALPSSWWFPTSKTGLPCTPVGTDCSPRTIFPLSSLEKKTGLVRPHRGSTNRSAKAKSSLLGYGIWYGSVGLSGAGDGAGRGLAGRVDTVVKYPPAEESSSVAFSSAPTQRDHNKHLIASKCTKI